MALVRSCKAPGFCECSDCGFWRRHRYYRRGIFGRRRYPWEPPFSRRVWNAVKRAVRSYNPIELLRMVEASGWGWPNDRDEPGYYITSEVRVARMVLHPWETLVVVGHALFGAWASYDGGDVSRGVRVLYRLKAALCLVLGWAPKGWREECECLDFTSWDYREYDTPDGAGGSCETLKVGYGSGNWFAYVEHESWP